MPWQSLRQDLWRQIDNDNLDDGSFDDN